MRIEQERKLYIQLVELRMINFESAGYGNKDELFKKAMMLKKFDLTTKQICKKLKVNENFLRENRDEYSLFKAKQKGD